MRVSGRSRAIFEEGGEVASGLWVDIGTDVGVAVLEGVALLTGGNVAKAAAVGGRSAGTGGWLSATV